MPIAWYYLIKQYFKIFLLALLALIAILIVSRLGEIAQVAAMGAEKRVIVRFVLYQIPYIVPLAIPISCLIASMILYQHLSYTHELTAMRAAGVSLWETILPILLAGAFLALATFFISSELSTTAQLATRKMVYDLTSTNPILLLQNNKLARLHGAYVQMDPLRSGEEAENLFVVVGAGHLTLFMAKAIQIEENSLIAKDVTLVSPLETASSQEKNDFILENQKIMKFSAGEIAAFFRKKKWKIANDHLRFGLLKMKIRQSRNAEQIQKCYSEIVRRIALGCSTLTFTLMGIAFGMKISRNQTKKGVIWVVILAAVSLISFFIAKELDHLFWIATLLFLLPHCLISALSVRSLHRINQGIG